MINHVLFPISAKTRIRSSHKNSLNEAVTTSLHNACSRNKKDDVYPRVPGYAINMRLKGVLNTQTC